VEKLPDGVGREMNDNELDMLRVIFELRAEVNQYKRALELACERLYETSDCDYCPDYAEYYLSEAKEADHGQET